MSESDQVNDMAFISHVMEARETIEEGEDDREIGILTEENDGVFSEKSVVTKTDINTERIKDTVAEIERLVAERDWVRMKEAAIRLRYLEGIRRAVTKWRDNP
jgi:molecular chaperone HscB